MSLIDQSSERAQILLSTDKKPTHLSLTTYQNRVKIIKGTYKR